MTAIYIFYIIGIIFLVLQLRENHCFFERKTDTDWSGYSFIWLTSIAIGLVLSAIVPVAEKNHRVAGTHRIQEGDDKYEGIFLTNDSITLKKVDKFSKRAVMYDDYSLFNLRLGARYRFEY